MLQLRLLRLDLYGIPIRHVVLHRFERYFLTDLKHEQKLRPSAAALAPIAFPVRFARVQ